MESRDPFNLDPLQRHESDIDQSWDSKHHTLGTGVTQAAPGNHRHKYSDISDVPSDTAPHEHSIYSLTTHSHSGFALSNHSHAAGAATNADTVDAQHFNWDDRGRVPTYLWGVDNYGDGYLTWTGRFSQPGHTHEAKNISGLDGYTWTVGTLTAGQEATVTISKPVGSIVLVTVQHPSTYIFAVANALTETSVQLKCRNSTTSTTHTNVKVYYLIVTVD